MCCVRANSKDQELRIAPRESDHPPAKTYSLTRRIIAAVVTCQVLLAVGLTLVAILYARAQLRGTFDAALSRTP